jgi:hypothetical protein
MRRRRRRRMMNDESNVHGIVVLGMHVYESVVRLMRAKQRGI